MAVLEPAKIRRETKFIDKEWLRKQIAEQNAQTSFVPVPGMTAEKARAVIDREMRERGFDPDSCLFSRGIVEMREE